MAGKAKPYIGVTGFTRKEDVVAVSAAMEGSKRDFFAGVHMNSATIRHASPNIQKCLTRDVVAKAFSDDLNVKNIVHFTPSDRLDLFVELMTMVGMFCCYEDPLLDGVQLNIAWPDPDVIREVRKYTQRHAPIFFILQVNAKALNTVGHNPNQLARKIFTYADCIDHVLLDQSSGRGELLDVGSTRRYIEAINHQAVHGFHLGVAGGLDEEALGEVKTLFEEFPHLSIDAQSRLLTSDHMVNVESARSYVGKARQIFELKN